MTRPIGVGLVGCGVIDQIHADSLRLVVEDGDITAVAVADPSEPARKAANRNCRFGYMTADPLAVIHDPDVEAVLIATPTKAHPELVMAALAAGKPLLCEKPLAPTFAEVRALADAVQASGLTAQVGFHQRFHPIVHHLRHLVSSEELGRVMGYTVREDQFWPTGAVMPGHSSWRSDLAQAGGGALLEHSIHAADVLCFLFGPPTRVFATQRAVFGYDVEDVAALTIEHESGVVGTLLTVFNGVRGREERRLEVFFEQAAVETTNDFIVGADEDSFQIQRAGQPLERLDLEQLRSAHFRSLGIERTDFLFYTYVAARAWAHAIRDGRSATPGFADALLAHVLVEAAYRSARTGTFTDVAEVLQAP
ncbi:MAG TPA: Gfo/Idh/MocA family oxidoreductase [Acidimicrobiales bacterium]|nr:Gfo/Idh/MocA family oxidoreductase [Acidimicrobiales bacterium]